VITIPSIYKSPESPRPKTKMFGFTITDIAGSTPDPRKYHKPLPDQSIVHFGPNSDYFSRNLMT
tara:strand:+ start:21567 stop:21758 length:192 start_codon:yes stop_codon:yes gene_type:complete